MARDAQAAALNAPALKNTPLADKPLTKASCVENLLRHEAGASLDEIGQATGWQPHTCRAFLTGLRKKGRSLERCKREDGATIYMAAMAASV